MAFREVRVFEVREALRLWLAGESLRGIERLAALDRRRSAAISRLPVRPAWSEAVVMPNFPTR
jgi:hypothetical protein